jgi:chemotaxis regulatin CheY-phosphate phosphatase CheZ
MHACVLALAAGIPHVAVDLYREGGRSTTKLREHMRELGFEHRYLTIREAIETDRLENAVAEATRAGRSGVEPARLAARAAANAHFDRISEFIERH